MQMHSARTKTRKYCIQNATHIAQKWHKTNAIPAAVLRPVHQAVSRPILLAHTHKKKQHV